MATPPSALRRSVVGDPLQLAFVSLVDAMVVVPGTNNTFGRATDLLKVRRSHRLRFRWRIALCRTAMRQNTYDDRHKLAMHAPQPRTFEVIPAPTLLASPGTAFLPAVRSDSCNFAKRSHLDQTRIADEKNILHRANILGTMSVHCELTKAASLRFCVNRQQRTSQSRTYANHGQR